MRRNSTPFLVTSLAAAALAAAGCGEKTPPLPEAAPGDVIAPPVIEGNSQAFQDMELPPGQLARVFPVGGAYDTLTAPLYRGLCLNCHAVSQTSFALAAWRQSLHARAGITCSACHGAHEAGFLPAPTPERCRTCHAAQFDRWIVSAHGPERAPGMDCRACHEVHATDRRRAADVKTCTGCHLASKHVQGYAEGRMGSIFTREGFDAAGDLRAPDCVYCHMPPDSLMLVTGDFRNDRVTLHDPAITVHKDARDSTRLADDAVAFLVPLCLKCHSERNARYRLANSALLIREWIPIGMTADVRRKPEAGAGAAPPTGVVPR